jgi:hypothetical protein
LPYESGNVTLMSALGLKVTEGRVPISKLTEDQHAHWLRWAEAHKTDTTPPSTATATPDDTNVTTTKTDELEDAIDERNA